MSFCDASLAEDRDRETHGEEPKRYRADELGDVYRRHHPE
jgi:hypothetical protein